MSLLLLYTYITIFPLELLRPRDTYTFSVEQDELRVFKTLDTPLFSTGKLILGPQQEKGKQHVGLDTLVSIFLHIFLLLVHFYFIGYDEALKMFFPYSAQIIFLFCFICFELIYQGLFKSLFLVYSSVPLKFRSLRNSYYLSES